MVERFNGHISEVVKQTRFALRAELVAILNNYMLIYNHHIPQRSLGHISPTEVLKSCKTINPNCSLNMFTNMRNLTRQFGFMRVRYRGLKKNTLQLKPLFALSNLWMVRHKLMGALSMSAAAACKVAPKQGNSPQSAPNGVNRLRFQLQMGLGCA
jgi:hypothetical protein